MKFMNYGNWANHYQEEADGEGGDLGGGTGKEGDESGKESDGDGKDTGADGKPEGDDADKGGIKLGGDDSEGEAPEEYAAFDMPEGVELDQGMLDKALPLMREAGMSQETAQKFVTLQAESISQASEGLSNQHVEQVKQWESDLKADTEIGGDKLNQTLANAKHALQQVGNPDLIKYLDDTGLSNHPELIRAFGKMGALMQEDNPGAGNGSGNSGLSDAERQLRAQYPDDFKNA